MQEAVIAERYARAMSKIARETDQIDRIGRELNLLADILTPGGGDISLPELAALLGSPRIARKDKIHITDVMLEKLNFTKQVGDLLNVLIVKDRILLSPRIAKAYNRGVAAMKGVAVVEVESAMSLRDQDLKKIQAALEKATGKAVELSLKINRDLIAGVRLHIGGKRVDGSAEGQLERLGRKLVG